MSDAIKLCPCGAENSGGAAFCAICGQPILDVLPVAKSAGPPKPKHESKPTPKAGKKVCPLCGTANESYAVICEGAGCGNDLTKVSVSGAVAAPTPAPEIEEPGPRLVLSVGSQEFECQDGDVIGREGTLACQIFAGIGTVSRRHVEIRSHDDGWSLVALAHVQNITQLDGKEMNRGEPHRLSGNHKLRMSMQCEVELKLITES